MTAIQDHISAFSNLTFSFENLHKRSTILGFIPSQANTNFEKDDDGVERYWFQLIGNYKSNYTRRDENGEVHDDNASIKTIILKFPMDYLKNQNIESSSLKKFFDDFIVGKKFVFFPVLDERQKFELVGKSRVPVKNTTETTIDTNFNLVEMIKSYDKKTNLGANKS